MDNREIETLNINDDDIQKGDLIVFNDGCKRTVTKVDSGHKLVFEDGTRVDLWTSGEKITGVIRRCPHRRDDNCNDYKQPFKSNVKITDCLATSHNDLFQKIRHGREFVEFYHLTALENAASIFSGDYFFSRYSDGGHAVYDNYVENETSERVMDTNRSTRLEKYARFYLNILNGAAYSMLANYKSSGTFGVIIALDFWSIRNSNTKVFISPINAHYLSDNDLQWFKYNIDFQDNLKNIDSKKFDFEKTFSKYNPEEKNPYLYAEILFYDKVPLSLVSHIYFKSDIEKNIFLNKIPYNKRVNLEHKCVVNKRLFWK